MAETPWGESFADLAESILADRAAPPVLALAAFKAKRGDDRELRELVDKAQALRAAGEGDTRP